MTRKDRKSRQSTNRRFTVCCVCHTQLSLLSHGYREKLATWSVELRKVSTVFGTFSGSYPTIKPVIRAKDSKFTSQQKHTRNSPELCLPNLWRMCEFFKYERNSIRYVRWLNLRSACTFPPQVEQFLLALFTDCVRKMKVHKDQSNRESLTR